jgi:hypothetical protein
MLIYHPSYLWLLFNNSIVIVVILSINQRLCQLHFTFLSSVLKRSEKADQTKFKLNFKRRFFFLLAILFPI